MKPLPVLLLAISLFFVSCTANTQPNDSATLPFTATTIHVDLPTRVAPEPANPTSPTGNETGVDNITVITEPLDTTRLTDFTNLAATTLAVDTAGNLWWGGDGGVVRFDGASNGWVKFTRADGLPSNQVRSIAAAPDGTIWVATAEGLTHYVDEQWLTYTTADGLADDFIDVLTVASDGTIWAASWMGLSYYDGQTWTVVETVADQPVGWVQAMVAGPDGTVRFVTSDGLLEYDGQEWTVFSEAGRTVMAVTPFGSYWGGVNAEELTLYHFDGETWTDIPLPDQPLENVTLLTGTTNGSLWINDFEHGLFQFDGQQWQTYDTTNVLVSNNILAIITNSGGMTWFGTDRGVTQYDGTSWQSFTINDNPTNRLVSDLSRGANGEIWIAAYENATVSRYAGGQWTTYSLPEPDFSWLSPEDEYYEALQDVSDWLPQIYVTDVTLTPRNEILAGGNGGIFRFDGEQFVPYTEQGHALYAIATLIAEDKSGGLWFSTMTGQGDCFGLIQFQDGIWNEHPSDCLYAMTPTDDGAMWFGTDDGLIRYDGQEWTPFVGSQYLPSNEVSSLVQGPDGTLWVGTTAGLSHFDGNEWTLFDLIDVVDETFRPSLAIATDSTVWIWSAPYGLYHFDGQTLTSYTGLEAVLDNSETGGSIVIDDEGFVWLSMWDRGVYRFQP